MKGARSSPWRRRWLVTVLACAALLVVPALAWLLLPAGRPPPYPGVTGPASAPPTPARATPTPFAPAARGPAPVASPPADERPDAAPGGGDEVTGVVVDPDGKPAPGAQVGCEDRDLALTTTTGADGRFALPRDAASCEAAAHDLRFAPSEPVSLALGRDNRLELTRGGTLAGAVVDDDGAPVASYTVAVESFLPSSERGNRHLPWEARRVEDATGRFVWAGLLPGRYTLVATAEGRPPATSPSAAVEIGRTTDGVRIVLRRGATLAGAIRDAETQAPLAGAVVHLDGATQSLALAAPSATSDADGAFALEGVPASPFSLRVEREGYRTRIATGLTAGGPASFELTRDDGSGRTEAVGVGVILAVTAEGMRILGLVPGGPAHRAGVRFGDGLVRIDGTPTEGLTAAECLQRLGGPEGSSVTLIVARESAEIEITLLRERMVL
ncbi:MAG: carboxypeptidase regulatory-like domain-containing protein [Polyangiaceae bacterium]|nr:carboxypeptidase regulatory-like domain-containing protein [Polyangiaceae bacterium]